MYDNLSFDSSDWKFVVDCINKQLKNARDMLENKDTSPEDTSFYRGRIALAKEILNLPQTFQYTKQGK